MKKNRLKNFSIYILTIFILIASLSSIVGVLILSRNKIKQQILKSSIEQTENLSSQIKNTILFEIEDFVYLLESIENSADLDVNSLEKSVEVLSRTEKKGTFTTLGIIDKNGNGLNTAGYKMERDMDKIIKSFSKFKGKHPYYVTDILCQKDKTKKEISIGIPIYNGDKIEGVIFGHQPISNISKKIDSYLEKGIYFQVIDNDGDFIGYSSDEYSVVDGNKCFWEELKRHKFSEGYTYEKVENDIKNGKKGIFSLDDKKGGRYIVYEPLGVNKWYILSVITKEKLRLKAEVFQKISGELLFYVVLLNLLIIGIIIGMSYHTYKVVKKQRDRNEIYKILSKKTKDIFFEINMSKNILILYNSFNTQKPLYFPLELLCPETMVERNNIKQEDKEHYREFYQKLMERKNIEKFTIEMGIEGVWKWYRINSIVFDNNNTIGILEDFTEEQAKGMEIIRINEKSKYDFLTGLYNRETFENEFKDFLQKNADQSKVSALFLLDLDNFKNINDTFGHNVGDAVLKEAANTLKNNLRGPDILGRLGGDEFIILVKNVPSIEIIHGIAQRLNKALVKTYSKDGENITISGSIGIVELKNITSVKEAYEKADKALYEVKYNGRNSYFLDK